MSSERRRPLKVKVLSESQSQSTVHFTDGRTFKGLFLHPGPLWSLGVLYFPTSGKVWNSRDHMYDIAPQPSLMLIIFHVHPSMFFGTGHRITPRQPAQERLRSKNLSPTRMDTRDLLVTYFFFLFTCTESNLFFRTRPH